MANISTTTTVRDILCDQRWYYDEERECQILLSKDGTGHLSCRKSLVRFICAALEWKILGCSHPLDSPMPTSVDDDTTSGTPVQLDLEIKLLKQRPASVGPLEGWRINEAQLKDKAFATKNFTLTLEAGEFWHPATLRYFQSREIPASYAKNAFRIKFDKSPYPPPEEWKRVTGGVAKSKFWELREFCSHKLAREPDEARPAPVVSNE